MSKPKGKAPAAKPDALFDRVASILDQARKNVVRAVNTNMVLAYWLIGREIVEEIQRGKGRAEYGKKVVETLSTTTHSALRKRLFIHKLAVFQAVLSGIL